MRYGLPDETIRKIQEAFSHYAQIEKAIIYGSRAKGNFKNGSDIDLTLTGEGIDLALMAKLERELDDLTLPYIFDLSIALQISNPALTEHIERIGIVFYEKGLPDIGRV